VPKIHRAKLRLVVILSGGKRVRQGRTDRNRRKFRRTPYPHPQSPHRGQDAFTLEADLGLCLETALRDRIAKLSEKAHLVRSRLSKLTAYLDGTRRAAPAVLMGEEGEDMDFLLAEILALRSILAHSRRPMSASAVASSIFSIQRP
jgi:hypothetical protein